MYVALVEALAADISAGRLRSGDRLPTHRELARLVGASLGTVTRAYSPMLEAGRYELGPAAARTREELERGLALLAELLGAPARSASPVL